MKKNIFILALSLLAVYLWFNGSPTAEKPQAGGMPSMGGVSRGAPSVAVTHVLHAPLNIKQTFTAVTQSPEQFSVAARVGGTLQEVMVEIGDEVQSGQLMARLDDEEYRLTLAQAQAELLVAQANEEDSAARAALAKANLERARSLRQQNIMSTAELDQVIADWQAQEARLRVSQAQVEQQEIAVQRAELQLSRTRISADWNHDSVRMVERRLVQRGSFVSAGTPLFSLVQVQPLTAVVTLAQRDYHALNPGEAVEISAPSVDPQRRWQGTVRRKAPAFDEESRHARVEIELPNSEGLLQPGMFINVHWAPPSHENVPQLPLNAIVLRDATAGVFVVDDEDRARFRAVQTGRDDGTMVEILSPVPEEPVIVMGHDRLNDGATVKVVDETS
ncbi:efflux RND transporter periplasmic adaptor subunit [Desulfurispira natronophila]|uniref:RND family efflux transporter MFP subunit n=1 Tax=Desulfurispira natronophila TaxID=682562 RepID=A0A7W7Y342_9BACT|nr:efflux RND transporter periplasmic adaptor subunit [Desulfurispira natronophila]MBB5021158.1 RND family efflux transporter MFP subunit [Desulfurispira natronophila]